MYKLQKVYLLFLMFLPVVTPWFPDRGLVPRHGQEYCFASYFAPNRLECFSDGGLGYLLIAHFDITRLEFIPCWETSIL